MEDEIKRADEQIPDLKPDDGQTEVLIPSAGFRPEDSVSCRGTCAIRGGKLHTYDWMEDLPTPPNASDLVEIQFKNTRKGYFRNSTGLQLKNGDIVAVESSPGHDIGTVTLQGRLVYLQMHKNHINPASYEFKRVYRVARPTDIEKWEEAKELEHQTMLEARQIAQDLHLNMKIGDVEYQGDRTKAIFYYIADERVDFRELIKVLADRFHVRIEMRQIGARQEAGRIGGIGPCGREMCCASWMTSFVSVSTHSARIQDLSLNPVKLAGQCGKLKCCLNYELSAYVDAIKSFPPTDKPLETAEGTYYFYKYDIFKRLMWYSPQKDSPTNIVAVEADHVAEIQSMNAQGQKPDTLGATQTSVNTEDDGYSGTVELNDDLTRFDTKGRNRRGRANNNRQERDRGQSNNNDRHNRQDRRPADRDNAAPDEQQRPERPDRQSRRDNNRANRRPDNRANRPQRPERTEGQEQQENRGQRRDNNRVRGQRRDGDHQGRPQRGERQPRPNRPEGQNPDGDRQPSSQPSEQ
ncbi:MAG: hypothetical protein II375_09235 [Bacteroidales bacterium]|nr:hypothetical protein [Bacteroidales bacterium]